MIQTTPEFKVPEGVSPEPVVTPAMSEQNPGGTPDTYGRGNTAAAEKALQDQIKQLGI